MTIPQEKDDKMESGLKSMKQIMKVFKFLVTVLDVNLAWAVTKSLPRE